MENSELDEGFLEDTSSEQILSGIENERFVEVADETEEMPTELAEPVDVANIEPYEQSAVESIAEPALSDAFEPMQAEPLPGLTRTIEQLEAEDLTPLEAELYEEEIEPVEAEEAEGY